VTGMTCPILNQPNCLFLPLSAAETSWVLHEWVLNMLMSASHDAHKCSQN